MRGKVIEAALDSLRRRPEVEQAFSLEELLAHKVTASSVSDYSPWPEAASRSLENRLDEGLLAQSIS